MCLSTFLGFCEDHVNLHISKTTHRVFMHFKKVKKVFLHLVYFLIVSHGVIFLCLNHLKILYLTVFGDKKGLGLGFLTFN